MASTGATGATTGPATSSTWARVYFGLTALLVLLIVVQILVAGSGLFTMAHQLDDNHAYTVDQWNNSPYWGIHFFNAIAIAVVILLMLATAFIGKLSPRQKRLSEVLVGLMVLQGILGFIPWPAPIAALHVLNAFGMAAVAGTLMRETWAFGRPTA